ncbi:O-phosphoseryl-tRNA(Sec) selenium transferase [Geodia barretti]|uniref:O-phosphoseryl-tRNA(Sec) selenium transferase n=1 Tax=Geodia barretti TaxID=519541 RepID=A0AA35SN60_GEOBA|nr:O-phosphoseryl-tRNA(Sec) selenium transferase [Geodia barretti]
MNESAYSAACRLVPTTTSVQQGRDARRTHERHIRVLIEQRKLPDEGWSNLRIELLLQELALMDSNNFPENVGVGEREGRVFSELVARRHFRLAHGVGRSGDIAAAQPKAAGSSIIAQITNSLLLDLIRHAGKRSAQKCVLLPVATGMALLLVLLTLRQKRPTAHHVIWPRVDQKSCFKCIVSAVRLSLSGFQPVVVENVLEGDELRTDVTAVEEEIRNLGAETVACVFTTTSCFAPRAYDKLSEIAGLCKKYDIPHIVNNAYGVQSSKCMHIIEDAHRQGRVDAFIQSTDKNFLVPVGGSVVASCSETFVKEVAQTYPGRGSGSPCVDVFITLLSLGVKGYKQLCTQRKENYVYLKQKLGEVCTKHGERVLETSHNPISLGVTLSTAAQSQGDMTEFGSMLFLKNVSGTRVVAPGESKTIGPHVFTNWGSHHNSYPTAYFTVAAAIGMRREEVDLFLERLEKVFVKFRKKQGESLQPPE